jgi:hypothetical protein
MVSQLPDKDETSISLHQLLARLDVCMGGRVAEEMIFGERHVTSGASSDRRACPSCDRSMLTEIDLCHACSSDPDIEDPGKRPPGRCLLRPAAGHPDRDGDGDPLRYERADRARVGGHERPRHLSRDQAAGGAGGAEHARALVRQSGPCWLRLTYVTPVLIKKY